MPVRIKLKTIDLWGESMEDQVVKYENTPTENGQIVFYGASYFTRWNTAWGNVPLEDCILGKSGKKCAVNRGFGSSNSEHQLYYYTRMVRAIEPAALVYECYANGEWAGYPIEERFELGTRVMQYAENDFPELRIYILGPHPSPKDDSAEVEQKRLFSSWLREFAAQSENRHFVDVLGYPGFAPDRWEGLFIEDKVHFSAAGYEVYAKLLREALADELARY